MKHRPNCQFSDLIVFGGTSLDTVVSVQRFIGPDEKLWGRVVGRYPGGMGANVAATYTALGGRATLVSAIGRDAAGEESLSVLRTLKVDTSSVLRQSGSTFETLTMIDRSGEKAMLLLEEQDMVEQTKSTIEPRPGVDGVHAVPGRFSPPMEVLSDWRNRGVHVSCDIEVSMLEGGLDHRRLFGVANVVFLGRMASEMMSVSHSPRKRIAEFLALGPDIVALTMGREGAVIGSRSGGVFEVPAMKVNPVNTTGAGDAFAGAFLAGLSKQWPVELCAAAANLVAGRCTESYASQDPKLGLGVLEQLPEFIKYGVQVASGESG